MLFVQPFFLLIFLPLACACFYLARRYLGQSAAIAVIVVASAAFYAPNGPLPAALLAGSLCINLAIGAALALSKGEGRWRSLLLTVGLLA
ncbi:MAG TPA: hypothetical protein VHS81_11570, partial [Caulobacteraceae bacterium]|nr:hypothetical protein [Caulobacteraceae bacterium]